MPASNPRLAQALRYAAMGLSVIPLHVAMDDGCSCKKSTCRSPGKHPCVRWKRYQTKAADAGEIARWWKTWPFANIGIVTGPVSRLVVVDIDGEKAWAALDQAGIDLRNLVTPTVQASRGPHFYFRLPEGVGIGTKIGLLPKVDIKGEGGYAVAPPSLHASGHTYRWKEGLALWEVELAQIPPPLLRLLHRGRPAAKPLEQLLLTHSTPGVHTPRAVKVLNPYLDALAAEQPDQRHHTAIPATMQAAAAVLKGWIEEDLIWERLQEAWRLCGETDLPELERLYQGAKDKLRGREGEAKELISDSIPVAQRAVFRRLRAAGYLWFGPPFDWQRWVEADGRWSPRTEEEVRRVARQSLMEIRGGNQPTAVIDELIKVAKDGELFVGIERPRDAVVDGSSFWIEEDPDSSVRAGGPAPGILFADARVEVSPDGSWQAHPHCHRVFTPTPPLPFTWGDGSVGATPLWDAFCWQQFGVSPNHILRFVGSAMNGDASHQRFLAFWGDRGTGKSQMTQVLSGLLHPRDTFDPKSDWSLAGIESKRLLLANDDRAAHQEHPDGWNRIKSLTGGDAIQVHQKYKPDHSAVFRGLFVLTSNDYPRFGLTSADEKAWRRRMLDLQTRSSFEQIRRIEVTNFGKVILEQEGEALARRALWTYLEVVKAGGWPEYRRKNEESDQGGDNSRDSQDLRQASRRRTPAKQEILQALRDATEPMLARDIWRAIPKEQRPSQAAVGKALARMLERGQVGRKEQFGGYYLGGS